jgi:drug/metabolite transporter (DMT)-like permease
MAFEGRAHALDLLRLHFAVAGFGFAGVFGKLLFLSPVAIVAGRTGFAALSLGLLMLARPSLRGDGKAWHSLIPPGVLLALHWWLFFQSIRVSSVAVALVSFSAFPVLVILWEALAHRRVPALRDLAAALIALAGVAVIVPRFDLSDTALRGVLWGLASGVAFAVIVLWNRRQVQSSSPWLLAFVQNLVAFAVLLPLALAEGVRPTAREWGILACLGIIFTAGTHGFFVRSLRSVPAKVASLVCTLEPAYGILASALVLKEIPTVRTVLGAVLVIGAVVSVTLKASAGSPDSL